MSSKRPVVLNGLKTLLAIQIRMLMEIPFSHFANITGILLLNVLKK